MLGCIKQIIAQYVEIDPDNITEESKIRSDIKINSYDLANIIIAVEDEFGISIPERDAVKFQIVGDLINYIENTQRIQI